MTGERFVRIESTKIPAKIAMPHASFIELFISFRTALKISTHTHTRTPANACATHVRCEKAAITPASALMITSDGNTTPSVATMPPAMPRCF